MAAAEGGGGTAFGGGMRDLVWKDVNVGNLVRKEGGEEGHTAEGEFAGALFDGVDIKCMDVATQPEELLRGVERLSVWVKRHCAKGTHAQSESGPATSSTSAGQVSREKDVDGVGEGCGALGDVGGLEGGPPSKKARKSGMDGVEGDVERGEELQKMLTTEAISEWNYDIFRLQEISGGNALTCMAETVMSRFGIVQRMGIDPKKMSRLLSEVQAGYNTCLYHNSVHAADVTHAANCLISAQDIYKEFPDEELLAYLLAGPMHDIGHPGVTASFLQSQQHPLVEKYGEDAVLENFHIDYSLELIEREGMDIISHLPLEKQDRIKSLIKTMILVTDMNAHEEITECMRKHGKLVLKNQEERELFLKMLLHLSDLSSLAKEWPTHVKWSHAILAEFYSQGDLHAHLKSTPPGFCQRNFRNGRTAQKNFITKYVIPPFNHIANANDKIKPLAEKCLEQLHANYDRWQALGY